MNAEWLQTIIQGWFNKLCMGATFTAISWFFLWVLGKDKGVRKDHRKIVIGGLLIIGVVAAHLLHTATVYLTSQLEAINRGVTGQTGGHIRAGVVHASVSSADPESAWISCYIRGVNRGAPTVLINWKVTIVLPSGQEFTFRSYPPQYLKPLTTNAPPEFAAVFGDKEKYLPSLFIDRPVPSRGGIDGWVAFLANGLPAQSILVGSRFIIEFENVDGQLTKIEHAWTAVQNRNDQGHEPAR